MDADTNETGIIIMEGAIISMPLCAEGKTKGNAFISGALSGAVEPVGALLTILAAGFTLMMALDVALG